MFDDEHDVDRINILDSHGRDISSSIRMSSRGIDYIHHRDNHIYYTGLNIEVYCIKKDGSNLFTFSKESVCGCLIPSSCFRPISLFCPSGDSPIM
jgi:hypothetical protein